MPLLLLPLEGDRKNAFKMLSKEISFPSEYIRETSIYTYIHIYHVYINASIWKCFQGFGAHKGAAAGNVLTILFYLPGDACRTNSRYTNSNTTQRARENIHWESFGNARIAASCDCLRLKLKRVRASRFTVGYEIHFILYFGVPTFSFIKKKKEKISEPVSPFPRELSNFAVYKQQFLR